MINFILPNFYDNSTMMQGLISDRLLINNIYGIEGGFSFSIFRGKINNNKYGNFVCYQDMKESIDDYKEIGYNLTLIDCGNLYLKEFDYTDTFNEVLFELYKDSNNIYFEVADEKLINFLVNTYPHIQLCLHENYTIFHTEKEIEELITKYSNNIKFINITLLNLCSNINYQKIAVLNLDSCFYCPHFPICLKIEHEQILRYKEASQLNDCERKKLIALDSLIDNLKTLLKQTNMIMFSSIAISHLDNYMELIEQILIEEEKGTFNEKL